jgi:hypothetical protein
LFFLVLEGFVMKSVLAQWAVAALLAFGSGVAAAQALPAVNQAQVDAQVQEAVARALAKIDLQAVMERAVAQAAREAKPAAAARPRAVCADDDHADAPRSASRSERAAQTELDPETAQAIKGLQQTALKTFLPIVQSLLTDTLPAMMKDVQADLKGASR